MTSTVLWARVSAGDLIEGRSSVMDDPTGMVKALHAERALKRKRLKRIDKVMSRPVLFSERTRARLVEERAREFVEIQELTTAISEYEGGA